MLWTAEAAVMVSLPVYGSWHFKESGIMFNIP